MTEEMKERGWKKKKERNGIFNMVSSQDELTISYLNQVPMHVPRIPGTEVQWH